MPDLGTGQLATVVVNALSSTSVCDRAAQVLRNYLAGALRQNTDQVVSPDLLKRFSEKIAEPAWNTCVNLSPQTRGTATAFLLGGSIYGITQLPEESLKSVIENARVGLTADLSRLGGRWRGTTLTVSPTLAPLVGRNTDLQFKLQRQFRTLGFDITAGVMGHGSDSYGAELTARHSSGSAYSLSFNAENRNAIFFRLEVPF